MASFIYALIGASFTLLTAWALGAILLRKLSPALHGMEQRLLAIVTGSAFLSAIVFTLATLGIARKGSYLILGLLAGVVSFWTGAHRVGGGKPFPPLPPAWQWLFVVAFGGLTVLHLFSAAQPEIYPREITQHLSQVDQAHGFRAGITLPEGAELLLPAFAVGRHVAAELAGLGILASLSFLVLCYGRRIGHPAAGVAAALVIYAIPAVGTVPVAALFALFYLLQLLDEQHTLPLLLSIGILAGYCTVANPAAIVAFPYAIGMMTWKLWQRHEPVFRSLIVTSLTAFACSVPWVAQQGTPSLGLHGWLPQQYRWEFLAVALACAVPLLWALRLSAGRQLLLGASVFAIPLFTAPSTQVLACVEPFAMLAVCVGWSNPAFGTRYARGLAEFASRTRPAFSLSARSIRFAGAIILVSYFAFFSWDGLNARFSVDDPSNTFGYWSRGAWALIRAQFEFFSTYYRPMGGLFYLPIYELAGFNPLPYRAVALLLVLCNIALFYYVAKSISGSERIAWVAAVLIAYHPQLADIVYQVAVIYDVLCFLFYFAAFAWYLRIRARGQFGTWRQTVVFAVLYICALNSKEMAVTLPLTLGLFELLFHPPPKIAPRAICTWLLREGRVCLIAAVLTLVYVMGKTLGPDPLIAMPGYQPEFTVQKFMNSIASNMRTLFYLPDWFGPRIAAGTLAALLVVAWIKRSRYVAFCVLFAVLSELPIAFIGRSGSCLYIPFAAWAMLVSAALWAVAQLLASMVRRPMVAGQLVAIFLLFNARLAWSQTQFARGFFDSTNAPVWSAMQQFSKFEIHPPNGASIVFLNDPLPPFTTMYLAYFRFQDLSLHIRLSKTTLLESELSGADYVFDYRDGRFVLIKP